MTTYFTNSDPLNETIQPVEDMNTGIALVVIRQDDDDNDDILSVYYNGRHIENVTLTGYKLMVNQRKSIAAASKMRGLGLPPGTKFAAE